VCAHGLSFVDGLEVTFYSEVRSKEAAIRNRLRLPTIPETLRHKLFAANIISHELFYAGKALGLFGNLHPSGEAGNEASHCQRNNRCDLHSWG
jgi:hypothetical protein